MEKKCISAANRHAEDTGRWHSIRELNGTCNKFSTDQDNLLHDFIDTVELM